MTKLSFLLAFPALLSTVFAAESTTEEQCLGLDPMPSVSSYLGMTLDYETADRICCHNHHYAEPRGYLEWAEVDFFSKLNPTAETVFYDSVCGIPLFVAPRGRSFEEFKKESIDHGWPSFRPEEIISENVIIHPDGRMESKCLTHLGHNLPSHGVDRYCIDLVCIAGMPLETSVEGMPLNVSIAIPEDVLTTEEFDGGANYTSSAEQWSGKNNITKKRIIISVVVVGSVLLAVLVLIYVKRSWSKQSGEPKGTNSPVSTDQKVDAMDEDKNENMSAETSGSAEGV